MKGKAMNTSEVYFKNVVEPNVAKAEEKQKQIDAQKEYIKEIEDEIQRLIKLRGEAGNWGNESAIQSYQKQINEKNATRRSAQSRLGELMDELKEIKTTAQLN